MRNDFLDQTRRIVLATEKVMSLPAGTIHNTAFRNTEASLARHVAFYVARKKTRQSFGRIGDAIASVDHRAVMYGFNRVSILLIEKEPSVTTIVESVQKIIEPRETARV